MIGEIDKEYQERFTNGLIKLMFETSMDAERKVAMVRSYECIDAMMTTIAMLSATSQATASPSKTREYCDIIARKIQRRIGEAKLQPMPFETITETGLN
jgi:hypothetical protein